MSKRKTPWPRLSETLPGREIGECQQCRAGGPLEYWREHDDDDAPTGIIVALCSTCANRIIEPHPRLYSIELNKTPLPGLMEICRDCVHRQGLVCKCPASRFNGGEGIYFEPKGNRIHLCARGRNRGLSGWRYILPGPVTQCSGKQATNGQD